MSTETPYGDGNYWWEQRCRACHTVIRISSNAHRATCGSLKTNKQEREEDTTAFFGSPVKCQGLTQSKRETWGDVMESAIEAQRGEVSPSMPLFMLPPAHTSASLQAAIAEEKDLAMIEPFKRQVSWATPLVATSFSCRLCGAVVDGDSFCVPCHLSQRRIDLEALLAKAELERDRAMHQCSELRGQLESNRVAAQGLVVVHANE
jgi:hypothetical protein